MSDQIHGHQLGLARWPRKLEWKQVKKRRANWFQDELLALVTQSDISRLMSILAGHKEHYNNRSALWIYSQVWDWVSSLITQPCGILAFNKILQLVQSFSHKYSTFPLTLSKSLTTLSSADFVPIPSSLGDAMMDEALAKSTADQLLSL